MWTTALDTLTAVAAWPGWQPVTILARAATALISLGISIHRLVRILRPR
jgi:hypothetical protein